MALYLGLLIFSFILTGILIIPFIDFLYKLKFTRKVEAPKKGKGKPSLFDKMHDWKAGTPVGGGILLIALVSVLFALLFPLVSYLGFFVTTAYPLQEELNIIFLTFLSFGLLGLYDDYIKFFSKPRAGTLGLAFGLRKRHKFAIQWILGFAIAFLIWRGLGIEIVNVPLFDRVFDLGVLYVPFAAFTIVSFVNAVNVTDGLDGLASGILLIALFAFWIISAATLDTPLSIFIALWIGALIAFLYFNVWPARVFLGDSGALSFGAMLAVIGLLTGKIAALVVIGGLFVLEIASALIQIFWWRVFHRPLITIAPLHLWFQARGWEEPKIVMRAWLAGIMLAIFGLWLAVI